jgi:hypothetical protein
MRIRDRLGIGTGRQRRLAWALEVGLVGMLLLGIVRGRVGIVVNSTIALAVTQLPPVLERDLGIPMDPGLVLWITAAVFLHVFGTVGFPGSPATPYQSLWWYDHLTHALSASIVAAVGYASARAVDVHRADVYLPPTFTFVFILLFVLAFGVLWEVLEFAVGGLGTYLGATILTQYGLEDTMLDLVFDLVGAVIVATWGGTRLSGVVEALVARLDARRARLGGDED